MASASRNKSGGWSVQWYDGEDRSTLYLGKAPKRFAEEFARRVEGLVAATRYDEPLDRATRRWLETLDKRWRDKLAAKNLAAAVAEQPVRNVGELCDYFLAQNRAGKERNTLEKYEHGCHNLREFFGADRPIGSVTPGDVDEFRRWLRASGNRRRVGGLSATTESKRCLFAQQVFRAAVRKRWVDENPFDGLGNLSTVGEQHQWVDADVVERLIDATADLETRLMLALARYGGLRIGSELRPLRWEWWNRDPETPTLTVLAWKTRRFPDKRWKQPPVFPEIDRHLAALYEAAPDGAEHVFSERFRRVTNAALRNRVERLCLRQGVALWPDLFNAMRSTRYTELIDGGFPEHVVIRWLGHCRKVARRHYGQVTKEHLARAASWRSAKPQNGPPAGGDHSAKSSAGRSAQE